MTTFGSQVITVAHDPQTGEEATFPTPADVPDDWIRGKAPEDTKTTADRRKLLHNAARIGSSLLLAYLVWEVVK